MAPPLDVYICASGFEEDERLRAELEDHLDPLVREGQLRIRRRRRPLNGTSSDEHAAHEDGGIEQARIILLLASPDFAASHICMELETKRAIERQTRGDARVIPVLLRAHDWSGTRLAELPALPLDGEPAAERADRGEVWREIARSLRAIHARGYLGIPAPTAAPLPSTNALPRRAPDAELPSIEPGRPRAREMLARSTTPKDEAPFLVPSARNPRFTGHDATLAALHARLQGPDERSARHVGLTGPGGIGKTQLALEYAYRHREDYPGGVYWIDAAEGVQAGIAALTKRLAQALAQAERQPRHRLRSELDLGSFLSRRPTMLVVFDHIANPRDMWRALFPASHRRELRQINIVQGAAQEDSDLEVPALSEEVALSLLLSGRREPHPGDSSLEAAERGATDGSRPPGGDDIAEARRIARALGRVPLALTLAAAHLRERPEARLRAYRDHLEQTGGLRAVDFDDIDGSAGDARQSSAAQAAQAVQAALRVQLASLSGEAPRQALSTAALLGRGGEVPREQLALAMELALREPDGAPGPLAKALVELEELELIDVSSAPAVRLHPLVQAFARAMIPDHAAFVEACADRMASALGDMDRLTNAVVGRGISAVLADLGAGVELGATRASTALRALARALETAAPGLSEWKRDEEPAALLQGLCNAAVVLRLDGVRGAAEAKLRAAGLSYLRKVSHPLLPSLRTIQAPGGRLRAIAVTASSGRAVTAAEDGSLAVWDLETGACLHTLAGHTAAVNDVAVTAVGHLAVSASDDGTVRVFRLDTGELVRTLHGHAAGVTCVALTPDARLVVSGARDGGVVVWNLTGWDAPRWLNLPTSSAANGPAGGMADVALTPDGRFLITARGDNVAHIWDLETGEIARTLVHGSRVRRVEVTAGGTAVLTVADGAAPRLWDIETGILVRALAAEKDASAADAGITVATMTPACSSAVVALHDGSIEVWEQKTGRRTHAFEGHSGEVVGLAVTPYAERAVSASSDGTIRVWELALRKERDRGYEDKLSRRQHVFRDPYVSGLAMTADGRLAVSTNNEDSRLKLWDVKRGRLVRVIGGAGEPLGALTMTRDGRVAVTMGQEPSIKIWDLERGEVVRSLQKSEGWVDDAAVTADARFLVTAESGGGLVNVRDLQGDGEARALEKEERVLKRIAVTPNGRSAITVGLPNVPLNVWDLASGQLVRTIEGCRAGRESVVVSSDGRYAFLGAPPHLTVVDLETGVIERQPQGERSSLSRVAGSAVTEDGRFAFVSVDDRMGTGKRDSTLEVWDLREGRCVAALPLDLSARLISVSADGRSIVAGDSSGALCFIEWVRS